MAFLGLWLGLGETLQIRGAFSFLGAIGMIWLKAGEYYYYLPGDLCTKKDKGDLNNFMLSLGSQNKKSLS